MTALIVLQSFALFFQMAIYGALVKTLSKILVVEKVMPQDFPLNIQNPQNPQNPQTWPNRENL